MNQTNLTGETAPQVLESPGPSSGPRVTATDTRATALRYPLAFTAAVLVLSWCFTAFLFSAPERARFFPYIMFIPACCAIVVSAVQHRSLKALVTPVLGRIDLRSLLVSFLLPVVVIVGCAFIGAVTGIAHFRADRLGALREIPSLVAFLWGVSAIFGEEYGWRGYLLPRLARAWGPVAATAAVGGIWAAWHAPVLFGLARLMGTGNPYLVAGIQMCAVMVFSFPFAYVFLRTGNIIPPMVFHYVWNHFNPIILGNIYRNRGGIMEGNILLINGEGVLGSLLGLLFVVWFIRRAGKSAWGARAIPAKL